MPICLPLESYEQKKFDLQGKHKSIVKEPRNLTQTTQLNENELSHKSQAEECVQPEQFKSLCQSKNECLEYILPPSPNDNVTLSSDLSQEPPIMKEEEYASYMPKASKSIYPDSGFLLASVTDEIAKKKLDDQIIDNLNVVKNQNFNPDNEAIGSISPAYTRSIDDHYYDNRFSHYSFYQPSEDQSIPSHNSQTLLARTSMTPRISTPQSESNNSQHSIVQSYEHHDFLHSYPRNFVSNLCEFDPRNIEEDSDDGLEYRRDHHRSSVLSIKNFDLRSSQIPPKPGTSKRSSLKTPGVVIEKKSTDSTHDSYKKKEERKKNQKDRPKSYENTSTVKNGTCISWKIHGSGDNEKSEWLSKQSSGRSKLRLIVFLMVFILITIGIIGAILNSILHKKSSNSRGDSAANDLKKNGDLNKNSGEIKRLLNNPKLHKVFPAIDYTPKNAQYPDCLSDPISQNDITRDLAILSQLSNTFRLYGTDCNQTEMLIYSINKLDLNEKVKIWMGVWLNRNQTTNDRQITQMYHLLDKYGADPFAGIIVGNEVIFRQDMSVTELGDNLSAIKSNIKSKGISLPVATSDLGDNWTAELTSKTDLLMANIHPFFAGVSADIAASWVWNFWQQHNVVLQPNLTRNFISETGWPSFGGINCGGTNTCTMGSEASIDAMNKFMSNWVCQALENRTNYFWFEAFDEPWKVALNEPGKAWEDKWGLLDAERNLKPGLIIPNCGGKTVS